MSKAKVCWFTGISGAGKSTWTDYVKEVAEQRALKVAVIDGDDVRGKDTKKLDFSRESIVYNNHRIADLVMEMQADYDLILVPVIAPYDTTRLEVREKIGKTYHLVYLETDIDSVKKRDVKGLYKKADDGLVNGLIGYSDSSPYEPPSVVELTVNTSLNSDFQKQKEQVIEFCLGGVK